MILRREMRIKLKNFQVLKIYKRRLEKVLKMIQIKTSKERTIYLMCSMNELIKLVFYFKLILMFKFNVC